MKRLRDGARALAHELISVRARCTVVVGSVRVGGDGMRHVWSLAPAVLAAALLLGGCGIPANFGAPNGGSASRSVTGWEPTGTAPSGSPAPDTEQLAAAMVWLRARVVGDVTLEPKTLAFVPSAFLWEVKFAGPFAVKRSDAELAPPSCPAGTASIAVENPTYPTGILFLGAISTSSTIATQSPLKASAFTWLGPPSGAITKVVPCPTS